MKPEYGPLEEEIHFGNHHFEVPTFVVFSGYVFNDACQRGSGGIYLQGKLLVKIPASSALTLSFPCGLKFSSFFAKKTVKPCETHEKYHQIS